MALNVDADRFEELVAEAFDAIPDEYRDALDNCVLVIEDEGPDDAPDLLGYYDGVALPERGAWYGGVLPDRIVICRGPLLRFCRDLDELREEIRITVWHEVAHYFGIDDHGLDELGYA